MNAVATATQSLLSFIPWLLVGGVMVVLWTVVEKWLMTKFRGIGRRR